MATGPTIEHHGTRVSGNRGAARLCIEIDEFLLSAFSQKCELVGCGPRRLEPEDIKPASFHLSRFVRSGERERK